MAISFIHLRVHTEYSLIDGLVRIKPLIKSVAAANMPAVAITDQNNLSGLIKFYKAANGAGIKPIGGVDLWVANSAADSSIGRLTLLVMNEKGYRNLTELISKGYEAGQHGGMVIVQREWLKTASEGLIALSGAREGDIGQALLSTNPNDADELLADWLSCFGDRFYLEVQRTNRPQEEEYLEAVVKLATRYDVALVATNDVRFITAEEF